MHACGYDSIPSDVGVHLLHERVTADGEGELTDTTLVVTKMRGGLSGGTFDSMRVIADLARQPEARKVLINPHALSSGPGEVKRGDRKAEPSDAAIFSAAKVDPSLKGALAPFIMASYNTRIVRRTNFLLGGVYGDQFKYGEAMAVGRNPVLSRVAAAGVAAGMGGLFGGLAMKPTRSRPRPHASRSRRRSQREDPRERLLRSPHVHHHHDRRSLHGQGRREG